MMPAMNDAILDELEAKCVGVRHGLYTIESKEKMGSYVCSADDIRRLINEVRKCRSTPPPPPSERSGEGKGERE